MYEALFRIETNWNSQLLKFKWVKSFEHQITLVVKCNQENKPNPDENTLIIFVHYIDVGLQKLPLLFFLQRNPKLRQFKDARRDLNWFS